MALALLSRGVPGWWDEELAGKIIRPTTSPIECGSVFLASSVFVFDLARQEYGSFCIQQFCMNVAEPAHSVSVYGYLMRRRNVGTMDYRGLLKIDFLMIAPIITNFTFYPKGDVLSRGLSKVSNGKTNLSRIIQRKFPRPWIGAEAHMLFQDIDIRAELGGSVFTRDLVGFRSNQSRLTHRRSGLFCDVKLVKLPLRLLDFVPSSFGGCYPGLIQGSVVSVGAVSRSISSRFCIESGKDGRNNGYGGEAYANATQNKLAQSVGFLSLRNEIRALRDAVRLTTNSKAFPVAAREAFLASMAGICSGGLAVGIPLWIAFGWRRRNQSKGRN